MQKRIFLMLAAVLTIVMLLNSCGALFMGDEEKELVGLWSSNGWNGSGTCYYDFEDNGNVFVTDFTDTWTFYHYPGLPVHFNYSISSDTLKMSQYLGIIKFEFEINPSSTADTLELDVLSATGDFDELNYGDTLILTRIIDYTEQDEAARAFFEGLK